MDGREKRMQILTTLPFISVPVCFKEKDVIYMVKKWTLSSYFDFVYGLFDSSEEHWCQNNVGSHLLSLYGQNILFYVPQKNLSYSLQIWNNIRWSKL